MIILGIDPGDTRVGFGVVQKDGVGLSLVESGCMHIPSAQHTVPQKLATIERELLALIHKHRPDVAAVEEIFFAKNVKTGIRVAQARGVILATCEKSGVRILEFTPSQIKQAVCGYGKADKKQVQRMIQTIFNIKERPSQDDAADAVAAALCASSSV
ncbi:crossover junction endodeoxyribonuclease RuvC [Candidatus Azambacteria bacterium]|nr:crossover junction endodeoxyribonuclease RuvC [Candidatus Azambacteria bacterium]